jgi:LysR family transcriptional regulator, nitrogen assimilation regulatory protein
LELRQLRTFVALVENGSMTAASQSLGLAQSTISEALASLEKIFGTPVFMRERGLRAAVVDGRMIQHAT